MEKGVFGTRFAPESRWRGAETEEFNITLPDLSEASQNVHYICETTDFGDPWETILENEST